MPGTDAQGGPDTTGAGRETADENDAALMRSIIQRIATGPELSKDISRDEARRGMRLVLDGAVDPVRAAVFLIALRMKRETDDENLGILGRGAGDDRYRDRTGRRGRGPVRPLQRLQPESARIRLPSRGARGMRGAGDFARSGVDGTEVRRHPPPRPRGKRSAGRPGDGRDLQPDFPTRDVGWAYCDQSVFNSRLHALAELRSLIVKRPALTTVEVMAGPVRGRRRTHVVTGYVHKPYAAIYTMLARCAGFDSALIVRGIEGGNHPLAAPGREGVGVQRRG